MGCPHQWCRNGPSAGGSGYCLATFQVAAWRHFHRDEAVGWPKLQTSESQGWSLLNGPIGVQISWLKLSNAEQCQSCEVSMSWNSDKNMPKLHSSAVFVWRPAAKGLVVWDLDSTCPGAGAPAAQKVEDYLHRSVPVVGSDLMIKVIVHSWFIKFDI